MKEKNKGNKKPEKEEMDEKTREEKIREGHEALGHLIRWAKGEEDIVKKS